MAVSKILNFILQKFCMCNKMTNMRYAAAYQSFTAIESCKKKSRTKCAACVWFQSLYGPSRAKVLPSRPATVCETLAYFCQKMRLSYAKFLAARYLELLFRAFLLNPTATQVFAMHAQLGSSSSKETIQKKGHNLLGPNGPIFKFTYLESSQQIRQLS